MKTVLKKWTNANLILRILCGIAAGTLLGFVCPGATVIGYLGTMFVSALKAVAPILVFLLVMSAISKAGEGIGAKFRNVIILYMLSTFVAALIAVLVHFAFPLTVTLTGATEGSSAPKSLAEIFGNLLTGIVENPVSALSNANFLAILFWAVVIGFALKLVSGPATINAVEDLSNTVSKVVGWVIQCAPFGIMGIMFENISSNGLSVFGQYGVLIVELVGTMLFVMLVSNPLIMFLCTRENPYPLVFRCIRESAVSAFFTRSSAANIPVNMALCEKLGLDREFYSVSIPLGSTINMDGAAVASRSCR